MPAACGLPDGRVQALFGELERPERASWPQGYVEQLIRALFHFALDQVLAEEIGEDRLDPAGAGITFME